MTRVWVSRAARGVWVLAAIGCSDPGDTRQGPHETGQEALETTRAGLSVMVTPADGAGSVSVLSPIHLDFSLPIDEGTLDASTVQLFEGETRRRIDGEVTTDGTTVTFSPARPLPWGTTLRLEVDGLQLLSGEPVDPITSRFTTFYNVSLGYTSSRGGEIIRVLVYGSDEVGRRTDATQYDDPGTDGIWYTADDPVTQVHLSTHTDGLTESIIYSDAGADGTWRTDDDIPSYVRMISWDEVGQRSAYNHEPGSDGIYLTEDDTFDSPSVYLYDDNDERVIWRFYADAGADGIPHNGDDPPERHIAHTRLVDGTERVVTYRDPGADTIWFTEDDVPSGYRDESYDERGWWVERTIYGAGLDGAFLTDDDVIAQLWAYERDERGLVERLVIYDDPGVDETWGTEDDTFERYNAYAYDEQGNILTYTGFEAPGDDGVWFTDDDVVRYLQPHDTSR